MGRGNWRRSFISTSLGTMNLTSSSSPPRFNPGEAQRRRGIREAASAAVVDLLLPTLVPGNGGRKEGGKEDRGGGRLLGGDRGRGNRETDAAVVFEGMGRLRGKLSPPSGRSLKEGRKTGRRFFDARCLATLFRSLPGLAALETLHLNRKAASPSPPSSSSSSSSKSPPRHQGIPHRHHGQRRPPPPSLSATTPPLTGCLLGFLIHASGRVLDATASTSDPAGSSPTSSQPPTTPLSPASSRLSSPSMASRGEVGGNVWSVDQLIIVATSLSILQMGRRKRDWSESFAKALEVALVRKNKREGLSGGSILSSSAPSGSSSRVDVPSFPIVPAAAATAEGGYADAPHRKGASGSGSKLRQEEGGPDRYEAPFSPPHPHRPPNALGLGSGGAEDGLTRPLARAAPPSAVSAAVVSRGEESSSSSSLLRRPTRVSPPTCPPSSSAGHYHQGRETSAPPPPPTMSASAVVSLLSCCQVVQNVRAAWIRRP